MEFITLFLPLFLLLFVIIPFICYFVRIRSSKLARFFPRGNRYHRRHNRNRYHRRHNRNRNPTSTEIRQSNVNRFTRDRQGNIFTISDETATNTGNNRYPDFFYLEPNGDDAARIRSQLEKDDKDLPSYEDVMRMTTPSTIPDPISTTPTITTGNVTNVVSASNLEPPPPSPEMTGPVPPYSEIDPNSSTNAISAANAASTSRGASVTIPIDNSSSNTSI